VRSPATCVICQRPESVRAQGRCTACYWYRRRTGHERPSQLIAREQARSQIPGPTPRSKEDLCWLAGYYEGEGSICTTKRGSRRYIRLEIASTDLDVLHKVQAIAGGHINDKAAATDRHKRSWQWNQTSAE